MITLKVVISKVSWIWWCFVPLTVVQDIWLKRNSETFEVSTTVCRSNCSKMFAKNRYFYAHSDFFSTWVPKGSNRKPARCFTECDVQCWRNLHDMLIWLLTNCWLSTRDKNKNCKTPKIKERNKYKRRHRRQRPRQPDKINDHTRHVISAQDSNFFLCFSALSGNNSERIAFRLAKLTQWFRIRHRQKKNK